MTQAHEIEGQNPGKEPKVVQMPSREDMVQRLQGTGLYGLTPQTDAFLDNFVGQVAGDEKVGMGLNMAWELAGYDTLRQYPVALRTAVNAGFDRVIDAVTPDEEVARDAKEFRKEVEEKVKAERIAAEPKPEDLGPADSLDDFERFSQAREIANIVFEYANGDHRVSFDRIWMEDWRNQGANPFYDQTHRGFFLEGYYGQLSKLHTPWGGYSFGGSGSGGGWDEATPKILERLGAVEVKPEEYTEMGAIGPVWAVHSVDGVALPDPVEKPRSQFASYEEASVAWKRLDEQYKASVKSSK